MNISHKKNEALLCNNMDQVLEDVVIMFSDIKSEEEDKILHTITSRENIKSKKMRINITKSKQIQCRKLQVITNKEREKGKDKID